MSESLSIALTAPGQAQQVTAATGPTLRTAQYSPGINQRGDERANLTFKSPKKGDLVDKTITSGTPYLNLEALRALPGSPESLDGDIEGSGDASEPDDSSHRQQVEIIQDYLAVQESMQNATAVGAGMSGALLVGTFALAIVQSPTVSRKRRKVSVLFVRRAAWNVAGLRVFLTVVLVVIVSWSISDTLSLADPVSVNVVYGASQEVQRGSLTMTSLSQDVTISSVDTSRAMVLFSSRSADSGPDNLQVTARLVDGTTLRFEKYDTVATVIQWEVIEDSDFTVQAGEQAYGTTGSSVSVDITAVDLSKSFIIISNRLNSGTQDQNVQGFVTGRFIDKDTISLERATTGSAGVVSWQVVSIAGASVQSGSFSMVGTTSGTASITPVDLTNSFLIFSTRASGVTNLSGTSVKGALTDAQTVTFSRTAGTGTASTEWFVIEWNRFTVQRGQTTVSGTAAIDQAISEVSSLKKTFRWHSRDSTGNGTVHANAALTSALTSTTNLQFLKGTGGQTQVVNWQVVEIISVFQAPLSDTMTISDEISTKVSRSVSDNVGMTDAISTSVSRSISDSLGVTDGIRTGVSRSIPESVAVTDDIAKSVTKQVADNVTVTDDVVGKVTARSVSDSISTSDEITIKITRLVQDSVSITDGIEAKVTARSVADSLNVSDAILFRVSRSLDDLITIEDGISAKVTARAIADTVAITDDIAAKITARVVADSLGITDAITAKVTGVAVSDELGVSDQIVAKVTGIAIADTLGVADNLTGKVTGRATGDSVTLVDSVTTGVSRSAAEVIPISDTVDRVHLAPRSVSDSVGVTDSIVMSVSRAMSDTVAVAEATTRTLNASRPASETLSVTDSISTTRTVPSSATDTVTITETIAVIRGTSGSPSDSVSISDTITKSVTRLTDDGITVTDSISVNISVSKSMSDGAAISDSISTRILRPVSEAVTIADSVSRALAPGRAASDTVTVADSVSRAYAAARTLQDTIALTDGISVNIARSEADMLGVSDSIETLFGKLRGMSDGVVVADNISVNAIKSAADAVTVSDDITKSMAASRSPSESIAATDSIEAHRAYSATINDAIAMTDTISTARSVLISDTVAITEELQIKTPSLNLGDSLAVSDTISGMVTKERAVTDGLTIGDAVVAGRLVTINDSVTVTAALTDVSWARTLNLTEQMTMSGNACTPVECAFNLNLGESLALADGFAVLRAELEDTVAITDAISAGKSFAPPVSDALAVSDMVDYLAKFTPPAGVTLGPMVTTDPAIITPPAATPVTGTHSMSHGVEQLVSDLNIPSIDTASLITTGTTLVLPTYHVPLTSTSEVPADDTLMTVKVTTIPANTSVMISVDMAATPGMTQGDRVPWVKMEYTPQVDSTDFALVMTPLDSQPADAPQPQADLTPLYIDIRWTGTFTGSTSPASSSYYATPPTFTFALTDAWANTNNAQRDANGVPLVSLNLLNEVTNSWETIGPDKIDEPTGPVNGQYVYVAHLEHFSTYVVTADTAPSTGGRGSARPTSFAVDLSDSLRVGEEPRAVAVEVIEEFGGRTFSVVVSDRLGISTRAAAFKTFSVGENVDVSIGIQDITQEGILSQTAKAAFLVQVANRGANYETFQLNFWYVDQSGRRVYESSQEIEMGPFETKEYTIAVPFYSTGDFTVVAEARSVPEGKLLNATQFSVFIPWLTIYFNALLAVAAAIIAASVTVGMLFMRTVGKRDRLQSRP